MYSDSARNPKVAALSDRDHRTWVNLLGVASENDGHIPPLNALKHLMMVRLDHLSSALDRLAKAGLIDVLETGYEPHNWNKFQYKSDTSNERVTLHRERKKRVTVTPPDTETESETDNVVSISKDISPALKPEHVVEAWNAMAARTGLASVVKLTEARRKHLNTRIRQYAIDDFISAIDAIERSPFLLGENGRAWRADFDFLLQPSSFIKLIEGSYDRKQS